MQVEWYGRSAFRLSTADTTVAIDPFGDVSGLTGRGVQFDYPAIEGLIAEPGAIFDIGALPKEDVPVAVVPAAP
jgi:L-ascorbate metabolism protein UlaG (beta-lactamase superfamily)